jgi:hypothetical protein
MIEEKKKKKINRIKVPHLCLSLQNQLLFFLFSFSVYRKLLILAMGKSFNNVGLRAKLFSMSFALRKMKSAAALSLLLAI